MTKCVVENLGEVTGVMYLPLESWRFNVEIDELLIYPML